MRAIVKGDSRPAVSTILGVTSPGWQREEERVKSIIMTSSTIRNIPWCPWIVESIRVGDIEIYRIVTLGVVNMTRKNQVDAVLIEQGLKDILALCAYRTGFVLVADVPWAMAS